MCLEKNLKSMNREGHIVAATHILLGPQDHFSLDWGLALAQARIPCASEAGCLFTLYPSFSFLTLLPLWDQRCGKIK